MTWLIVIISIILVVIFWRIFAFVAVIAALGLGIVVLYFQAENNRNEQKQKQEAELVRHKIADAQARIGSVNRHWEILSEADPASSELIPRSASVLSDDGLCRLQVEQRVDRTKLTGIYCSVAIESYKNIEVKFDNRPTSDTMRLEKFSNGDSVYIPSNQYISSGQLGYDEFLRRISEANKVSLLLTVERAGQYWIRFSLTEAGPALIKIGAISPKPSTPQYIPKKPVDRVQAKTQLTLPANAKLNVLGNDWQCVHGYRRSGSECLIVQLPANAKLNVLGNDWECQRGFRRSGSQCMPVYDSAAGR